MANFNFNKVIIGGRLTADPELKTTLNGVSVTSFPVAINKRTKDGEQTADFIDVTAWRNTAEFITQYFHKASSICIVGHLQKRCWTDDKGQKRYSTDVVADEVFFVDSKQESSTVSVPTNAQPAYVPEAYSAPKFEEVTSDDDLPF